MLGLTEPSVGSGGSHSGGHLCGEQIAIHISQRLSADRQILVPSPRHGISAALPRGEPIYLRSRSPSSGHRLIQTLEPSLIVVGGVGPLS